MVSKSIKLEIKPDKIATLKKYILFVLLFLYKRVIL